MPRRTLPASEGMTAHFLFYIAAPHALQLRITRMFREYARARGA